MHHNIYIILSSLYTTLKHTGFSKDYKKAFLIDFTDTYFNGLIPKTEKARLSIISRKKRALKHINSICE